MHPCTADWTDIGSSIRIQKHANYRHSVENYSSNKMVTSLFWNRILVVSVFISSLICEQNSSRQSWWNWLWAVVTLSNTPNTLAVASAVSLGLLGRVDRPGGGSNPAVGPPAGLSVLPNEPRDTLTAKKLRGEEQQRGWCVNQRTWSSQIGTSSKRDISRATVTTWDKHRERNSVSYTLFQ